MKKIIAFLSFLFFFVDAKSMELSQDEEDIRIYNSSGYSHMHCIETGKSTVTIDIQGCSGSTIEIWLPTTVKKIKLTINQTYGSGIYLYASHEPQITQTISSANGSSYGIYHPIRKYTLPIALVSILTTYILYNRN